MAHDVPVTAEDQGSVFRLPDGDSRVEFAGELVASVSQAEPGKLRWVELSLYRVTDGSGRYVLHRVGRSLVYHRDGGSCRRGVLVSATDLPANAVPCQECRALGRDITMALGRRVSLEQDHHGVDVCVNARDVIGKLRMPAGSGSGVIGTQFSAPAQRIVDQARLNDPGINAELMTIRKL